MNITIDIEIPHKLTSPSMFIRAWRTILMFSDAYSHIPYHDLIDELIRLEIAIK